MVVAFVQEVVAAGNAVSATPLDLTLGAVTTTVGNYLVLSAVGSTGVGVTSVTDSKGNSWSVVQTNNTGSSATASIAFCQITVALVNSDVIHVNFAANNRAAASVQEWSSPDPLTFDVGTGNGNSTGNTTGATGSTATSAQTNALVYGALGHVSTVSSFTPEVLSPVWTQRTTAASTSTVRTIRPVSRVVSDGPTTYAFNSTWTTSRAHSEVVAVFKVTPSPGGLAQVRIANRRVGPPALRRHFRQPHIGVAVAGAVNPIAFDEELLIGAQSADTQNLGASYSNDHTDESILLWVAWDEPAVTVTSVDTGHGHPMYPISAVIRGADSVINFQFFYRSQGFVQAGDNPDVEFSGTCNSVVGGMIWSGAPTFDKQASATGSSTSPDSGATATTSAAFEFLAELIVDDIGGAPTWANGEIVLSNADSNPNVPDGHPYPAYRIVSATGAYNAAGTISDVGWGAQIATFMAGWNAYADFDAAAGTGSAFDATKKVSPNAGNAAGTGAAGSIGGTISFGAGVATGTGAAGAPVAGLSPNAGNAGGTGAAGGPTSKVAPVVGAASGTGSAGAAADSIATNAGLASGTGVAYDATVSTAAATSANAGNAAGTGAAGAASVSLAPNSGVGAGTGAAAGPSSADAVPGGLASGTGAAFDATAAAGTSASAGLASGTGSAFGATTKVSAGIGVATGTGTAYDPQMGTRGGHGGRFVRTIDEEDDDTLIVALTL